MFPDPRSVEGGSGDETTRSYVLLYGVMFWSHAHMFMYPQKHTLCCIFTCSFHWDWCT